MEHFNGIASESLEVCCAGIFPHARGVITVLVGGGVSLENTTLVVDADFETFPMAGAAGLQTERASTPSCDRATHNLRHFINVETRANSQNFRFIEGGSAAIQTCSFLSLSVAIGIFLIL